MSDRPALVEVLLRQREAWQRGDRKRVEEFLDLYPHLRAAPDSVLDLIYNETVLREEAGERVEAADYLRRFPDLEEPLRVQFEVEQALTAPDLRDEPGSTSPYHRPATPSRMPRIDGCELLDELGRGAMGIVYRGWQPAAKRPVAVKVFASDMPAGRVRTEIDAASRLSHPNVVQVFEVKDNDGYAALVLEHVEGGNLAQKLAGKPQPADVAAHLVEVLAHAMAYAHSKGVVHRDLKPSNVLLSCGPDEPLTRCTPKIGDFGLAKLLEGDQRLTATSDILGTPSYMAPEQTGGQAHDVGPATDVWALGAILYECLTGRPPFLGQGVLETLEQVRHQDPVRPSEMQPKTPRDLEIICLKCLQKQPGRRYAGMAELAEDLRRYQAGEPILGRAVSVWEHGWKWARRRPVVAAAVVGGVLALSLAGGVAVEVNRILRGQRDLAWHQAEELDAQLQHTRRLLYTAQLLRVGSVWEGDPAQALRMLEDPAACPPDLRCFSWGVLHAQCKRYRREVPTAGGVTAVAWHPDGRRLATAGDGKVTLYDDAGDVVETVAVPDVTTLAYSKDGTALAAGTSKGLVQLVPGGGSYQHPGGRIAGLAWHQDRQLVVAGGGQVVMLDGRTLRIRRTLKGETHPSAPVAVSPDGQLVAGVRPDHAVQLWDARVGGPRGVLRGHTAPVAALLFTRTSKALIAGGVDGTVRVWDPQRENESDRFFVGTGAVTGLSLDAGEQILAVSGSANSDKDESLPDVQLWDLVARRAVDARHGHPGGATGLAFAPDGRSLATVGHDRTLKLWDHPGQREQVTLRGHVGSPGSVARSADGRVLAWVARAERLEVNVLDLQASGVQSVFRGHGRPIQAVALSADGQLLAAAAGHPGEPVEVLVWEVRSGRLRHALAGHPGDVAAVAFRPDGKELASAGREGLVKVWDLDAGKPRWQAVETTPVTAVAWGADGKVLAVGGGDGVAVYAGDEPVRRLAGVPGVACVAVSNEWVAYGGAGGVVRLVSRTGDEARELAVGMKGVAAVAFAADGQTLAVAGAGPGVKLWDVATAQERATLPRHRGGACYVEFTGDGRQLVTVSRAQVARLWASAR